MLNKKIERIMVKYFSRSASKEEITELTEWLNQKSNDSLFIDFAKTNYFINANMLDFDIEEEKEKVLKRIKTKDKKVLKVKFNAILRYAAILVLALGIGYTYFSEDFSFKKDQDTLVDTETLAPALKDKATLTLENGNVITLENGKDVKLSGRTLRGKKLIYDENSSVTNNTLQYNHLTIARGNQFFVQLSDGTKIWLNSDSKLKFPINFIKGETRKVELVYGEAYFEVSKSTNHNGDGFKVQTGIQEIDVLGTQFNIKAYKDEGHIVTTLVEGEVLVGNGINHEFLEPKEQSIIDVGNQNIAIRKVDKLFDEIAWKNGYFSFKKKSMKEIMKVLSRWYDIEYAFKDPEKETMIFSGILDREESIEQVLDHIKRTNEINIQINDQIVIIE